MIAFLSPLLSRPAEISPFFVSAKGIYHKLQIYSMEDLVTLGMSVCAIPENRTGQTTHSFEISRRVHFNGSDCTITEKISFLCKPKI